MTGTEFFLNRLGVKWITEGIKLSNLEEDEINVYFVGRNNLDSLNIRDVEELDKELLDSLILNYGGTGAMVKVECLISDIRTAREKLGHSKASLNLWLLLVSLKEFKSRLAKLCVIDIEYVLLKAFLCYTNGKSEIDVEEFINSFNNRKPDVSETIDLEEEIGTDYIQLGLFEVEPKVPLFEPSNLGKAISCRMNSSSALYKLLSNIYLLVDFIDFGCILEETLKKKNTMETTAIANIVSAAIKDVIDSSGYQFGKNKNVPGQMVLKDPIRK